MYEPSLIPQMAAYGWLICVMLLMVGSLASSQNVLGHNHSKYPPDLSTICHDDSLTKGYKCEDYDVRKSLLISPTVSVPRLLLYRGLTVLICISGDNR